MKRCTCFALKAINCICDEREKEDSFAYWFYKEPHRIKYSRNHPAFLAAQEAWEASRKRTLEDTKDLEGVIEVKPVGYHSLQLVFRSQTDIEKFKAAHDISGEHE